MTKKNDSCLRESERADCKLVHMAIRPELRD
jgi:hypothetical protein